MMLRTPRRPGMTAIEVLAATVLASLLMTALIGVLRGLKAHERALDARSATPAWQRSLDHLFEVDFREARTYVVTGESLTLAGYGGRSDAGAPTWRPGAVVYEIRSTKDSSWLVKRQASGTSAAALPANLVLKGVAEIRVGPLAEPDPNGAKVFLPKSPPSTQPTPVTGGLVIELWAAAANEPLYRYQLREL